MADIFIDSFFLACPLTGAEASSYLTYVNDLTDLEAINSHQCLKLLIRADAIDVLENAKALPPWKQSEIDLFVQREEVSRLLFGLLSKLTTIEDHTGIREILIDDVGCEPSAHLRPRPSALVDDYFRTLALMSIGTELGESNPPSDTIITKGIEETTTVTTSGVLLDIEYSTFKPLPELPMRYEKNIRNVPNVLILKKIVDTVDLWKEGQIECSIEFEVLQHASFTNEDLSQTTDRYHVRDSFCQSVYDLGFGVDETRIRMLLRACTETILETDLRDTHALRTSVGGNAKQITRDRDGASAWRRDVDHEHHLHYWQTPRGVELVLLVKHDDFRIPE